MEDHRPKTLGLMESTDEIDILFDDEQCPSVHFLIEVDTKAEADLIVQAAEAATMQLILMPLGDSLTDSPIRILKPFVDVS